MSKELNLLPQVYNAGEEAKKKKKNLILVTAGGIALVGLGVGYVFGRQVYLEYQKKYLIEEVNRNKEMVEKDKRLNSEISLIKSHIEKAKSLEVLKSKSTDKLLKSLSDNFPQSIILSNLNYTKAKITLSGTSSSKNDIWVLWGNLRESKQFQNSYITSIIEGNGTFTFNLEISLGGEEVNG